MGLPAAAPFAPGKGRIHQISISGPKEIWAGEREAILHTNA